VPCAHQCRDPFLALGRIGRHVSERPDAASLGQTECGIDRFVVGMGRCVRAIRVIDTGAPKLVRQPPFAVAPRAQRARLGQRKSRIVDQSELGEPGGQCLEVRLTAFGPAPLADFAGEIFAKLGTRRCVFPYVAQRELTQPLLVERRWCATGLGRCLHA